jgi:Histidine kinase-, DNA gyrase B-, and HSP90-like ATPase
MSKQPLVMQISLNALEHLGMNLYSNVPAVLSEIVANAWDADATEVVVNVDRDNHIVEISDNGVGMSREDVVKRFLTVGYRRRAHQGDVTQKGRRPMGRKGIGKLSSFSIAKKVTVFTIKGDERTAFCMDRDQIKKQIESTPSEPYRPEEVSDFPDGLAAGTRIILSDLTKNLTSITLAGLRKRLARRFAIIGSDHEFSVEVNQESIGPDDRGYHKLLEYVWTFGDQDGFTALCSNLGRDALARGSEINKKLEGTDLSIKGWIGTVKKPNQLKDDEGDNLNRIAVFMRGKLAQEDMLADFGQKEIYADYVVGELQCEGLDANGDEDIATSNRQTLKQDDPRFVVLRDAVHAELRHIAGNWSDFRRKDGAKAAMTVPAVSEWLSDLKGDTKKKAERWIGRLNTIRTGDDKDQKELLKASILAFESYRRKEELHRLEQMSDERLSQMLPIFENLDGLELSYYGQIVSLRLGVILKIQEMLKKDVNEKVLQEYIFEHLWLLDPSWERAKGTEHIETTINKFLKTDTKKLNAQEKKGRIDIGYRTTSGKHVIIELKKASVRTPVDKLVAQVRKYRSGVKKILETTNYKDWPLEIICLLGTPPPECNSPGGPKDVADTLKTVDARIVYYNQLVDNAQRTYADYLEAHKERDRLWAVFKSIDDFAPDDSE